MNALSEYVKARRKSAATLCILLLGLIAAASLVVDSHHAHTWAEQHVPFFWSWFGFGAAAIIIGAAHWFGRSGIQVRPDFYDQTPSTAREEEH